MSVTVNDAQLRKLVLPAFTGYSNPNYIARQILPVINVKEAHGQVAVFSADVLRLIDSVVGERGKAAEVNAGIGFENYDCAEHFKGYFVSRQLERQFDTPISAAQHAAISVKESLLIEEERNLGLSLVYTAFGATERATPGTKWNVAGGDPVGDINVGIARVRTLTGRNPNKMVVTPDVDLVLRDYVRASHSLAVYSGLPTDADMAKFFGVAIYLVADASYNSAIEGQTAVLANAFGTEMCWLMFVPENPNTMAPAFGYTIALETLIETEVLKNPKGTNYLYTDSYQSKVLSYTAGYCLYNTLS